MHSGRGKPVPGTPRAQAAGGLRRAPGFLLAISKQDLLIAFDSPCGQGLFFFFWWWGGCCSLLTDAKEQQCAANGTATGRKVTCRVCQVSSQKESI